MSGGFTCSICGESFDSARAKPGHRKSCSPTEEQLISAIQNLATELGQPPTGAEMDRRGRFSKGEYERPFGSWTKAVRVAGFEPRIEKKGSKLVNCDYCEKEVRKQISQLERNDHVYCRKQCQADHRKSGEVFNGADSPMWKGGSVKVECSYCGSELERIPSAASEQDEFYCNHECVGKHRAEFEFDDGDPNWNKTLLECANCGDHFYRKNNEFKDSSEAYLCSSDCRSQWQSAKRGPDAANWRGGPIETECTNCGEEIVRSRHATRSNENHFCSSECFNTWFSDLNPEDHPQWTGGPIEVRCRNCGSELLRKPHKAVNQDNHFCDHECYGEYRAEVITGENHHSWRGGTFPYGPGWNESKKKQVRERDDFECQTCGMTQTEHLEEYDRKLDVHHIIPARQFDEDDPSKNMMENLITLCRGCHRSWEGVPLRPEPQN